MKCTSDFEPPAFPVRPQTTSANEQYSPEQAIPLSKDFQWQYTDRRMPQEIVPGIFLGPMAVVRDLALLERLALKTLISVRTPVTAYLFRSHYPERFRYESIDLTDGSIMASMPSLTQFIQACQARGERLLFYDETGNSKAALLLCSYLMDVNDMCALDAYHAIKSKRLSISFNEHERYQLEEYETVLAARKTIVAHCYSAAERESSNRRRKYSGDEEDAANNSKESKLEET